MAIDERFELKKFEAIGDDGIALQALSTALREEVEQRLDKVLSPAVEEIVAQLNKLGHDLRLYGKPVIGDIAYRDDLLEEGGYSCKLRLGVDVVVSLGFSDTIDEEGCSEYRA